MVYLLLGTNLGDKKANLERAIMLLSERLGVDFIKTKQIETEAIGFNGPSFLNQILVFEKSEELSPIELLKICQDIEIEIGRPPHKAEYNEDGSRKYVSRVIDIDILMFDEEEITTETLTLPHPQVYERPFVKELLNTIKYDTRRSF